MVASCGVDDEISGVKSLVWIVKVNGPEQLSVHHDPAPSSQASGCQERKCRLSEWQLALLQPLVYPNFKRLVTHPRDLFPELSTCILPYPWNSKRNSPSLGHSPVARESIREWNHKFVPKGVSSQKVPWFCIPLSEVVILRGFMYHLMLS